MSRLATNFVQAKKEKHNNDGIIFFVDNLSAHLLPKVKRIFEKVIAFKKSSSIRSTYHLKVNKLR